MREYHFYPSVDSTNDVAKRLLTERPSVTDAVIVSGTQTRGRGRADRVWYSETPDGLYYTYLSSDIAEVTRLPDFTLKIGKRVSTVVTRISGLQTQTEWPNDVLLGDRKVAGVLVETFKPYAEGEKYVIIGIGLNLNQAVFPEPLSLVATSLFQESGKTYPKWPFIAGLTQEIDRVFTGN